MRLLAFNVLSDQAETGTLLTMVLVVAGSVVMLGLGAPAVARAYARSQPRMAS
jgi:sodium/hydrogen antiporter